MLIKSAPVQVTDVGPCLATLVVQVVEFSSGGTILERFLPKKLTYPYEIIEF